MENNDPNNEKFRLNILELPAELLHHIITYCAIEDLLQLQRINKFFRSSARDLLQKSLASFDADIKSHINKWPGMLKLYENRTATGFDPELPKKYFLSASNKSLTLLALIADDDVMNLCQDRYTVRDFPWIPYKQNDSQIRVRVPLSLKFGYFSTMSIMIAVVGYLLFFDTSDIISFWDTFRWIDYIINEKRAVRDYPSHYVIIGYVFANKKRAVQKFQVEYFTRLMGMTYIEIDAEDPKGLDKVWPQMLQLFSTEDEAENTIEESNAKTKKKKSQPCKTQ